MSVESEQQLLYRTRMRASENRRWLQTHQEKLPYAYVPQRPNVSPRLNLQADTTVIDLTKPIAEVRIELPPMKEPKPRFGKRLVEGVKRGMASVRERIGGNKRQYIGAVALAGALTLAIGPSEMATNTPQPAAAVAEQTPAEDWYERFAETKPGVSYETFIDAVESQEFADMTQWAAANPDVDFARAMQGFEQ